MILSIDEEEFWSHVDRGDPEDCWEWQDSRLTSGYGRFRAFPGERGRLRANRIALCLATGEDYYNPLESLHSCDNPPCCNPNHLSRGTQADNVKDSSNKGRRRMGGWSWKPEAVAKAIELMQSGETPKIAAERAGISLSYAQVLKRKRIK